MQLMESASIGGDLTWDPMIAWQTEGAEQYRLLFLSGKPQI